MGEGMTIIRRLTRLWRSAQRRDDGVAMIEFALVLPIMIFIFVGMVEFGEAFTINRKVENAASTVADLVSQQGSVSDETLEDIVRVAEQVLLPYRSAPLSLRIISVVADAENRETTVAWSFGPGAPAANTAYSLRAGLTEANSSVIVVEADYDFTPTVGHFLGSFEITGNAFFRPRTTRVVMKTDEPAAF